jgi:hypothetical protein
MIRHAVKRSRRTRTVLPARTALLPFLPRPLSPKSFLFTVEHRGQSPAFDHPFRDGLGFDNGSLKIGLGLRYSPFKNLDAGLRRVNNGMDPFDTYEIDARYCFAEESRRYFDAAIRAGTTLFYQDTSGFASGYFASLAAGRSVGDRVYAATGILYHSNSTYFTKTVSDKDWTLCLPFSLSIRVHKGFSLLAEVFAPLTGYSAGKPAYAYGFKYATWRHSFSVLLTNTQYTTMDGVVSGSGRLNQPVLGFMITRKIGGD